ncbi:MAG: hypothetical protein PHS44_07155 [Candidatus Dojkabacteria bacterium]|nr:hypothetical protein [Candidatus Dojkabacteria bacterium]
MRRYLVYTFFNYRHLTFKLLNKLSLPNVSKYYIRGKNGVYRLAKLVEKRNYDFILGLGDYRINAKRIRIEEKFINKHGKSKIVEIAPHEYSSSWKLPVLHEYVHSSDKASNGPCNKSAFLVSHILKTTCHKTKNAFVHIPRSFDFIRADQVVKEWLKL